VTADTMNVSITTKVKNIGNIMSQHLDSIKQITTRNFERDTVIVSFNIDPDSLEHDQMLGDITVNTSNKKVKKAFKSRSNEFTFGSDLEKFNQLLSAIN
jgi:hypothetical protein